jgi:hypothetical protein
LGNSVRTCVKETHGPIRRRFTEAALLGSTAVGFHPPSPPG